MKRFIFIAVTTTLLLLLVGCGGNLAAINIGLNSHDIDLGIEPAPLGFSFTIDQETGVVTFTIPGHTLLMTSKAGAIGATVEGYTIEFYDSSGNPLFPGDHVVNSQGALNVYVPPGIICDEPDETRGCTVNSVGSKFARGQLATSPGVSFLPLDIASETFDLLQRGGAVGAYADFYLYGENDLGGDFRSGPYRFAVQVPVESGG